MKFNQRLYLAAASFSICFLVYTSFQFSRYSQFGLGQIIHNEQVLYNQQQDLSHSEDVKSTNKLGERYIVFGDLNLSLDSDNVIDFTKKENKEQVDLLLYNDGKGVKNHSDTNLPKLSAGLDLQSTQNIDGLDLQSTQDIDDKRELSQQHQLSDQNVNHIELDDILPPRNLEPEKDIRKSALHDTDETFVYPNENEDNLKNMLGETVLENGLERKSSDHDQDLKDQVLQDQVLQDQDLQDSLEKRLRYKDGSLSSSNEPSYDRDTTVLPQRRKGLIIVAHGRSGSTYTLQVFNNNPHVFAAYEPMLLTEWWKGRDKSETFNQTEAVIDILTAFMTCSFSKSKYGLDFLEEYSFMYHRMISNVLSSPPFCKVAGKDDTCEILKPEAVDKVCLSYRYSVVKIMYMRLPDKSIHILKHVLKRIEGEADIKIIHLVRDPRGNINSRIHQNWVEDYPSPALAVYTKELCELVEKNLQVARNFSRDIQKKMILLRYKDIAGNPVETVSNLYRLVDFEMPPSTMNWVKANSRPSRIDHWKSEAPPERTRIIESECHPLFKILGIEFDVLNMHDGTIQER